MTKELLVSSISFIYTLLYIFVIDANLLIFPLLSKIYQNTQGGGVWNIQTRNMKILLYFLLTIILILSVIFLFKKIEPYFRHIYILSLAASFILPLFIDSLNYGRFISFPWYFTGLILTAMNLLAGPAMVFLMCFLILKKLKFHL